MDSLSRTLGLPVSIGAGARWLARVGFSTLLFGGIVASFPDLADGAVSADCRRITLIDADTGKIVRGAEDLEVDRPNGLVFVAAVDRWALEEAVERNDAALPRGAIYILPIEKLAAARTSLRVRSAVRSYASKNPFHPQGIGLRRDNAGIAVAVVNRRYRQIPDSRSRRWRSDPVIEVFSFSETRLIHRRSIGHSLVCHPNDVAVVTLDTFAVTNDHDCNTPVWLEDVFGMSNASVVLLETGNQGPLRGTLLADDIGFANGIIAAEDGRLIVAATREKALRIFQLTEQKNALPTVRQLERIRLDNAPDNLSWDKDAGILVAVHKSLISLALYRHRWFGRDKVSSRVIKLSVGGDETVVFDDPEADTMSAATVAVTVAGHLVAGSVTDSGLAICKFGT